jgi:DNA-binding GntR family transcriptional regulator
MTSSHSDVYVALKYAITNFELKPGSRLVEGALSARYGVSRTPVREALHQLEQEGLVVTRDVRGRFVRDLDLHDYEDVSRVRLSLEELAVVQACERADGAAIAQLAETWDDVASSGGVDGDYVYADERFHTGVADLSRNAFLIDCLARVNDRIRIIRVTDFTHQERIAVVREQHAAILEAIAMRDADTARRLMREHIEAAHANIRALIAEALMRVYVDADDGAAA